MLVQGVILEVGWIVKKLVHVFVTVQQRKKYLLPGMSINLNCL